MVRPPTILRVQKGKTEEESTDALDAVTPENHRRFREGKGVGGLGAPD